MLKILEDLPWLFSYFCLEIYVAHAHLNPQDDSYESNKNVFA